MRFLLTAGLSTLCLVAALLFWQPDPTPPDPVVLRDGPFRYLMHAPDATVSLDNDLDEVSGLAYVDNRTLAMVNDEQGRIFLWDVPTESIIGEIDFGKGGDYEGLTVNKTTAYVLRSDGDVYEVSNYLDEPGLDDPRTVKHENSLDSDNDTEGLAYDTTSQQLLIACKATGRLEDDSGSEEALVYRFSPNEPDALAPLLTLSPRDMRPSGVAVHPGTGHYYLLSSADRQLAVFDGDDRLLQRIDLPRALFRQPEGICFSPTGTLYVANEARDRQPTLLRFNVQPPSQP